MNAQGPCFVDWTWPPSEERDYWAAIALRGGAPSPAAAAKLANRYADDLWWTLADARTAAEYGYSIQALDLNALQPIPRKILRVAGATPATTGAGSIGDVSALAQNIMPV